MIEKNDPKLRKHYETHQLKIDFVLTNHSINQMHVNVSFLSNSIHVSVSCGGGFRDGSCTQVEAKYFKIILLTEIAESKCAS